MKTNRKTVWNPVLEKDIPESSLDEELRFWMDTVLDELRHLSRGIPREMSEHAYAELAGLRRETAALRTSLKIEKDRTRAAQEQGKLLLERYTRLLSELNEERDRKPIPPLTECSGSGKVEFWRIALSGAVTGWFCDDDRGMRIVACEDEATRYDDLERAMQWAEYVRGQHEGKVHVFIEGSLS